MADDFNIQVFPVDYEGGRFGRGPIEDAIVSSLRWDLYGPNAAAISFDPLARNAEHVKLLKRELQVWFDDELIWWGVPLADNGDLSIVTLQCEGIQAHLRDRIIDDATLLYTSIDQLSIAWNLIQFAQSEATQANRDLNISAAAFAPSGKIRSREYKRFDHAIIFDLLSEFPTLNDGFDWEIVPDATGARFWTPYYPRKERTLSEHRLIVTIEQSRGIENFTWASSAMELGTHIYATGGSSGDVKFEENFEDVAASAEYGVRQRVISEGSQNDVAWLLDRATREVGVRKKTKKTPTISTARAPKDYFRIVRTGDWLPVYVDYGYYQIDLEMRIGSVEWTPNQTNLVFIEERDAA